MEEEYWEGGPLQGQQASFSDWRRWEEKEEEEGDEHDVFFEKVTKQRPGGPRAKPHRVY